MARAPTCKPIRITFNSKLIFHFAQFGQMPFIDVCALTTHQSNGKKECGARKLTKPL